MKKLTLQPRQARVRVEKVIPLLTSPWPHELSIGTSCANFSKIKILT